MMDVFYFILTLSCVGALIFGGPGEDPDLDAIDWDQIPGPGL